MSIQPFSLNDDVIVTPQEAADLLRTPVKTLEKWRSTGEHNIPYLKIGRNVRYRTIDLKVWVEAHVRGAV